MKLEKRSWHTDESPDAAMSRLKSAFVRTGGRPGTIRSEYDQSFSFGSKLWYRVWGGSYGGAFLPLSIELTVSPSPLGTGSCVTTDITSEEGFYVRRGAVFYVTVNNRLESIYRACRARDDEGECG